MTGIRIYLAVLISIVIGLSGCKKVAKLTQFEMQFDETTTVPKSSGINLPFNILTPDMETNSEATFTIHNTRKDLIEKILLKKLNISIETPNGEDFSFLKSIGVYLSAEGIPESKIAWKDDVQSNVGSSISLDLGADDLKEYIKKDKFSLRLNTVTDELLTSDYKIKVHSAFVVDAKILGQ